ncbi:prolyl oligopeptidase family serine peptidase [Streptomyces orinoci]|uniref:Prolyl oligopeptidase family serine peptidase n=2 Tax=Streptomyces orinoci TaxID=67339 RepID=A0ABV3K9G3_STRON|nr:prolyl oligopeptidase family serine peptidase [Streptomyces orinoci]
MTLSTAPHGSWPSPVTAELAAAHDGRPDQVGTVGEEVWWIAPRPTEAGRQALMRLLPDGSTRPALPAPWNIRTRLNEYGGRPWTAVPRPGAGPLVVFTHYADQRLYAWEPDGPAPRPLTPHGLHGAGLRWADPLPVSGRNEVWCLLEEFTGPAPADVRRVLAAVPLDGSAAEDRTAVRELTDDRHRFLTAPRLSPDGRCAAWLAWDHPRMPWDGTELLTAELDEQGTFTGVRTLMGGPGESIAQVEWAPDGSLLALSDRTGWWNPYRVDPDTGRSVNLCAREEEFAGPLWKVGQRWLMPLPDGLIAVLHGRGGQRLAILDPATGTLADAEGPWTEWTPTLAVDGSRVIGIAAAPDRAHEVVELDTCTGRTRPIGDPHTDPMDPAYYPRPRTRTFTAPDGHPIHAHLYPPHNPGFRGPEGELPPYVIRAHGGPTGRCEAVLDLETVYFTSRGIGIVDVDYGGSAGYGRAYRERLRHQWGLVDVQDCATVAEALAAEGTADPGRLAIRGGSAGGWTTAASLATTRRYACGTILYPVLDALTWAQGGTHDLESHYLESLIGPLTQVPDRYRERSPLYRADGITAPFLLLQGLDDRICPPRQSELFLAEVAGRGVPHAYLTFEGEAHGFRRSETVARALAAELSLYSQVFGFDAGPGVPALELRP